MTFLLTVHAGLTKRLSPDRWSSGTKTLCKTVVFMFFGLFFFSAFAFPSFLIFFLQLSIFTTLASSSRKFCSELHISRSIDPVTLIWASVKIHFSPEKLEFKWCQFWWKVMTSEVEPRPSLVTCACERQRRHPCYLGLTSLPRNQGCTDLR